MREPRLRDRGIRCAMSRIATLIVTLLLLLLPQCLHASAHSASSDSDSSHSPDANTNASPPDTHPTSIPASSPSTSSAITSLLRARRAEEARSSKFVVGITGETVPASASTADEKHGKAARTLVMTAKNGKKFRCTIPDTSVESVLGGGESSLATMPETIKQQIEAGSVTDATKGEKGSDSGASTTPTAASEPTFAPIAPPISSDDADTVSADVDLSSLVPQLIRRHLGGGCFTKQVDYWSYEVCPFRKVRQFHARASTDEPKLEFDLGTYVGTVGDMIEKEDRSQVEKEAIELYSSEQKSSTAASASTSPSVPIPSSHVLYTQLYEGGSSNRRSQVFFHCNPDPSTASSSSSSPSLSHSQHLLVKVAEPKPFSYEFHILTPIMCRDEKGKIGHGIKGKYRGAVEKSTASSSTKAATSSSTSKSEGSSETGRLHTGMHRRSPPTAVPPSSSSAASPSDPYNVMDLLEPLGEQCFYLNTGWWAYKYCYLKEVTQFHREQVTVPINSAPTSAASSRANTKKQGGGTQQQSTGADTTPTSTSNVQVKTGAKTAEEAAAKLRAAMMKAAAAAGSTATAATAGVQQQMVATKLVTTAEYVLGQLAPSLTLEQLENLTTIELGSSAAGLRSGGGSSGGGSGSGSTSLSDSWSATYIKQTYADGTICDLNSQPRSIESRIYCDHTMSEKELGSIKSVTETSTCSYAIVIHTPLICKHPLFQPIQPKVAEIVCQPIEKN